MVEKSVNVSLHSGCSVTGKEFNMANKDMIHVVLDAGKYTVIQDAKGRLFALRYGEPWQDLVGNNLVLQLAYQLSAARELLEQSKPCIQQLMPDRGDHHCGDPDAMCDGDCQIAASLQDLLRDIGAVLANGKYREGMTVEGEKRPDLVLTEVKDNEDGSGHVTFRSPFTDLLVVVEEQASSGGYSVAAKYRETGAPTSIERGALDQEEKLEKTVTETGIIGHLVAVLTAGDPMREGCKYCDAARAISQKLEPKNKNDPPMASAGHSED